MLTMEQMVGLNHNVHTGGNLEQIVGLNHSTHIGGNLEERAGLNHNAQLERLACFIMLTLKD